MSFCITFSESTHNTPLLRNVKQATPVWLIMPASSFKRYVHFHISCSSEEMLVTYQQQQQSEKKRALITQQCACVCVLFCEFVCASNVQEEVATKRKLG